MKKKDKLNKGHYIEIIDRIDCQNSIIEEFILGHMVFSEGRHPKLRKKIEKAQQLLAEVYQKIGQKH